MRPVSSVLDLLLESEHFDRIPRVGFLQRGVADPESVPEHSWHVALLVWALAVEVEEIDLGRALELALIHDLAELRIGDLPHVAGGYLGAETKHAAERRALQDLLAPLPEARRRRAEEYQDGTSVEARFVKACDGLQLLIKALAYEHGGHAGLDEFWPSAEEFDDGGFAVVRDLYSQLTARRTG
ncbi:MAG: HD domain-containing protein [Thermoanaerobaculia bacterium]